MSAPAPGRWVFVCGPSGAGKDSVIGWARTALAGERGIVFARRAVTRAAHPASDHEELSPAAFAQWLRAGRFAWHWRAHGFDYAVDAYYREDVARGRTVVVNGSREHVLGLPAGSVEVVLVTAPPEQLAQRLQARGREGGDAVRQRIARNGDLPDMPGAHVIVNASTVAEAGAQLRDHLLATSHRSG
ncbi:AAA family ATPase [Ramlibacter sp.]|uniref:AAA family ATPase n=1 Tax=Ramlibacter sp. TaxID=1917967 RepID=UPI001857AF72|nr:AAA family ATPase [Ramlibacter sp.]MBA2673907.1 AAA family ATPase [Ramlibacter sp.]